jgi:hypothetical protein
MTSQKSPPTASSSHNTGFDDRYQGHQTTYLHVANRDGSNPHAVDF